MLSGFSPSWLRPSSVQMLDRIKGYPKKKRIIEGLCVGDGRTNRKAWKKTWSLERPNNSNKSPASVPQSASLDVRWILHVLDNPHPAMAILAPTKTLFSSQISSGSFTTPIARNPQHLSIYRSHKQQPPPFPPTGRIATLTAGT